MKCVLVSVYTQPGNRQLETLGKAIYVNPETHAFWRHLRVDKESEGYQAEEQHLKRKILLELFTSQWQNYKNCEQRAKEAESK